MELQSLQAPVSILVVCRLVFFLHEAVYPSEFWNLLKLSLILVIFSWEQFFFHPRLPYLLLPALMISRGVGESLSSGDGSSSRNPIGPGVTYHGFGLEIWGWKYTLPETNIAPENRLGPKRKRLYSNHPFSGAMLVSGRVPNKSGMCRW